jgi:hypothetical protein
MSNNNSFFAISSDKGDNYKLIVLNSENNLKIKLIDEKNVEFEGSFDLDYIKENKYFLMCDNIKDVLDEINPQIENNKMNLIEDEKEFKFTIFLNSQKVKEISFSIQKIVDTLALITELKKENQSLKEKVFLLEETVKKNSNDIESIKKQLMLMKLQKKMGHGKTDSIDTKPAINSDVKNHTKYKSYSGMALINEVKGEIPHFKDSKIILTEDEEILNKWIDLSGCELILIFSKSINGNNLENFHKLIYNIPETLVVIETSSGIKFGGFTTQTWESSETLKKKKDKFTFMFSFSLKENYKSKDYSNFIEFKNDMGLCFGRNKFFDPAEEKIIISNLNEGKIQYQNTIFKNINGGETSYKIKDVEVYQIKKK